jgi:hypothetical protein
MPLREDQEKQLVSWCSARGISARCPMCGENDWTTGEVFAATPTAGSKEETHGEGASMVQIICDHCKLIMLFAASPILGESP